MPLLDLPIDLLISIPQFLYNIEDFVNASSSCRTLWTAFADTSPNTILRLAAASSRVFFRPDPHFLIAATVRQVSDWALLTHDNTESLRRAFQGGIDTLFELCVSKAGLTLDDIRRLHASRFSLINPVSDMIDRCAGKQWYSTPNFWNGGVSNPNTITVEPERSLFQILIYGDLFRSTMRAAIEPTPALPRFDLDMRLDFIKYCIPDSMCWLGYKGLQVLQVGPYASGDQAIIAYLEPDQVGLDHILHCRTWREAWEAVQHAIGPDFDEEWRQKMWHAAVQMQGLEGLEMLQPVGGGGVEKWRPRLKEMRGKIEALHATSRPLVHEFGAYQHPASDSPCMGDEVHVCMAGLWGPWDRSIGHDTDWDDTDSSDENDVILVDT